MITILVMVLIPSLMYVTFRNATVQTYLARQIAGYLSKELNAEVNVGGLNISWFLNIVLEDISVMDKKEQPLIYSNRLVVDIKRISFSNRTLELNKIVFDQASLGISKYSGEENYNFKFLTDYFFPEDSTPPTKSDRWGLIVRSLELRSSGLTYQDHNTDLAEYGFDYNNLAFAELDVTIKDIFLENDTLQASLLNFSVKESKGFEIENIRADFLISPTGSYARNLVIKTNKSKLNLNLALNYADYGAFEDFVNDVTFSFEFAPSIIDLYQVGYFIPATYGLDDRIQVEGTFTGQLSNLRARDLIVRYGAMTEFRGGFYATGLPDIEETFLNFSVDRMVTTQQDIESFHPPGIRKGENLKFPDEIANLGLLSFTGNFTGFIYDFVAYGQFQSAAGNISTDIAIISNYDFSSFNYRGNLSTSGFDLGKLLGKQDQFGKIALNTQVNGTGHTMETIDLEITGVVKSMEYNNYNYQNTRITGHFTDSRFNGNVLVEDPNIFLNFTGLVDFQQQIPIMNFNVQIDNANLSKLNIWERDSLYHTYFSTSVTVDARGSSLNTVEGEMNAFLTRLTEIPVQPNDDLENRLLEASNISLKMHHLNGQQKFLRLTSDFLDAQLEGEMNPETIGMSIQKFGHHFIPLRFRNPGEFNTNGSHNQNLNFDVQIKNTDELTEFLIPGLRIAKNSEVKGSWNTQSGDLSIDGNVGYVSLNNFMARDIRINSHTQDKQLLLLTESSRVNLSDSVWMDRFSVSGNLSDNSLPFVITWENFNKAKRNNGFINGTARVLSPVSTEISFNQSRAFINDSLWTLSGQGHVLIDSTQITVTDFLLSRHDEYLKINGILSNTPDDLFQVELNHFNIENIDYLLRGRKVDFDGIANGKLTLSGLNSSPNINANLLIKDFAFNNDHLGDLELTSTWDAEKNAFRIETSVIYYGNVGFNKPIVASGYFYPDREDDNFDLNITIENLKMSIFSRYVERFASNFRGLASGRLRLEGPLATPELSGRARLVRTGLKIDYLNTAYTFAHEIEVGKDFIRFDNLTLNDTLGNKANVTGILRHNNFLNFSVDISMLLDRMIVLNTHPQHNNQFYGKAFASGLVHVHGPVNNIALNISVQANRGTQIFLPLHYQGELKESPFITYVTHQTGSVPDFIPRKGLPTLSMNFDLSVTPESEVQLIFDSQIGDIIRGRGTGNLKFEITPQGAFYMYGDYMIDEGDYLFTLQNLINKRLRIQQGGLIRWSGNPYDADIDLRAIYRTRASLADLAMSVMPIDTSDVYMRRVPVETVLHLEDKLFNPTISFDIQIPGGDEQSREMIQRLITTEQEMNRQVFSLLILNRFTPNPSEYNTALGYGVGSTSFELLSNQLSNWLSQISSDFDIGINYRPGNEISSQELEVALSTQLFDNRVVIDGNLGVTGNHPAQTQRTSNIIGDVNIEVKITPEGKFRVKAFNRSNTFDVLNTNSPYTQGIGVFYRKEFDNLSDLFRRARRVQLDEIPNPEEADTTLPKIETRVTHPVPGE